MHLSTYYGKQCHYLLFVKFLYCLFILISVTGQATPISGTQLLPFKIEDLDMKITEAPANSDRLRFTPATHSGLEALVQALQPEQPAVRAHFHSLM